MRNQETEIKISRLTGILKSMGEALVAFSGGVDSTFLLKFGHDLLGDKITAITAESDVIPAAEIDSAKEFTAREKVRHVSIWINIFENKSFLANQPDRCYVCKLEVFRKIKDFAEVNGIHNIAEGSHHDDAGDYRPGARALAELGIRSPLLEAGLTKNEIRQTLKYMGLSIWDKPANPCLATRIPYNVIIRKEMLEKIDEAEKYLHDLGFREVRVRYHGSLARIEVPRHMRNRLLADAVSPAVARKFKELGFFYTAIDIEGYRMGSMNELILPEGADGQG